MSVLDAAVVATGSRTVRPRDGAEAKAAGEGKICSAIAVESPATWPGTVKEPRTRATTVGVAATSPETARSPRRSVSRCATPAARRAMWRGTATTPTSRSATPVEASVTSRRAVKRSSATGVARSATWRSSAARPARSTVTTAGSPVTWRKNAPSRPRPDQLPWWSHPSFL